MTRAPNDLDDLKAALTKATPRPDADRRAANLRLAQQNFDRAQGSWDSTRLTSATGPKGLWKGVIAMFDTLTTKGALAATTALVAVGVLYVMPINQDLRLPKAALPEANETAARQDEARIAADAPAEAEVVIADADQLGLSQPVIEIQDSSADMAVAKTEANQLTRAAPSAEGMAEGMIVDALVAASPPTEPAVGLETDTEAYANATPNPVKSVIDDPVSTFSIDVDTASYAVIRNTLNWGALPDPAQVRIEEMVNYFPYDYQAPAADEAAFRPSVSVMQTPWNASTEIVRIALQGRLPALADRPPLNLVFLIDTSGSMDDPQKLPLLKQSFRLMLDNLRPEDQVAIVEYAGSSGLVLEATPASDKRAILKAITGLGAGGSTNGQGGLEQAYDVAADMAKDGEVNRVILATDGDFNVGLSDPSALEGFIAAKRETGTYLSVLGFGRGNLDDATMQALAQTGNGTAAYIDTLGEAQKVLVDQLTGALFPIANDVKVQVEFNPAQVAEYRLIGYETRALNREDFNNDRVDAGEMGSGHAVTALYEITPVGSPAQLSDPLRYQPEQVANDSPELGFLKLRWKEPGARTSQLIELPILQSDIADTEANFAVAIAGFGQLLRDPAPLGEWGWDQAIALANANRGEDAFGYRTEAVQLMRLAQSLSAD